MCLQHADGSLFRNLLFSRFDTIHLILALDYPNIPVDQRRNVARALMPVCKDSFASLPLGDDYASRPEFRQLKEELRKNIRCYIDENGVPGYKPKLQTPKRVLSYETPLRKRKI